MVLIPSLYFENHWSKPVTQESSQRFFVCLFLVINLFINY